MANWLRLPPFYFWGWLICHLSQAVLAADETSSAVSIPPDVIRFVRQFCSECHNSDERSGGLSFDGHLENGFSDDNDQWEKAIRRIRGRQMPPQDAAQPEKSEYESVVEQLEKQLDA